MAVIIDAQQVNAAKHMDVVNVVNHIVVRKKDVSKYALKNLVVSNMDVNYNKY